MQEGAGRRGGVWDRERAPRQHAAQPQAVGKLPVVGPSPAQVPTPAAAAAAGPAQRPAAVAHRDGAGEGGLVTGRVGVRGTVALGGWGTMLPQLSGVHEQYQRAPAGAAPQPEPEEVSAMVQLLNKLYDQGLVHRPHRACQVLPPRSLLTPPPHAQISRPQLRLESSEELAAKHAERASQLVVYRSVNAAVGRSGVVRTLAPSRQLSAQQVAMWYCECGLW